jgi:hypothetical protein
MSGGKLQRISKAGKNGPSQPRTPREVRPERGVGVPEAAAHVRSDTAEMSLARRVFIWLDPQSPMQQ